MGYEAVVIGTSTGGMNALKKILIQLPHDFPMPIMIVQHLSPHSDNYLVKYLENLCRISVVEAEEKEKAAAGVAYIAPPNYHLMVDHEGCLQLSIDEKVNYARPAIDVLFETAADVYKDRLIGVLLTGANSDGSKGMCRIKEKGGVTIVQDPETAEADAMPRAALKAAVMDYRLSLDEIGKKIIELAGEGNVK